VINTTDGAKSISDSRDIRRTALMGKIPYYTTIPGAPRPSKASSPTAKAPRRSPSS
jgi:hypothetical protein